MSTIDQQFVEYIVKSLVEHPDDVIVERIIDEKGVLLTLTVNPEDLGRVIGRRGATAQSLRTMLRALGMKNSARYNLKIVNNDQTDDQDTDAASASSVAATAADEDDSAETIEPDETAEATDLEEADPDEVDDDEEEDDDQESDFAKKSRQELADLDDLDI